MTRSIYSVKTNPASKLGFVTVLQYLFARVGSRSRLTRISRTITSLTLRDVASPRINCVRASASASAVVISIAAAATALRLSINRAELRPVDGFMCMGVCVCACMRACYATVCIILLQSPAITLIKHLLITAKKMKIMHRR